MTEFAEPVPGHWSTDEGTDMANTYAAKTREQLAYGNKTDLELANAIFMVGRGDLDLIGLQTAAKERIRWLSVQLALARRGVTEIRMTPIADGLPVRDELRGEQTILTYCEAVGTWDIAFMESGWDDFDSGFAIGVSHWVDITAMWPGVIAQVAEFRQRAPVVTDGMVETALAAADPSFLETAKECAPAALERARNAMRRGLVAALGVQS